MVAVLLIFGASVKLSGADCNTNGVSDTQDIRSGSSPDCNVNGLPDECEFVPLRFGVRDQPMPIAKSPQTAVVADLNDDGVSDLVVGHQPSLLRSLVSVILGQKNGTPAAAVEYEAGAVLSSVATADLDLDGDLDIVTANISEILVFVNNGDGSLAKAPSITIDGSTRFATAAQVIGSPSPDLIAANGAHDVIEILESQGDGTFNSPVSLAVGSDPRSVTAGDFDGDGLLDLVSANRASDDVSVLLKLANGSFAPAMSHASGGKRPDSVIADDFDGDQHIDLLVRTSEGYSILMNEGDGRFRAPLVYESRTSALGAGDLDGDGDPDLVYADRSSISLSVVVNLGAGKFSEPTSFPLEVRPSAVSLGDLDGDGRMDLTLVSKSPDQLSVLWNDQQGNLVMESVSIETAGLLPHAVGGGDLNGDGLYDVIIATGGTRKVAVFLGRPDGVVRPPTYYTIAAANHLLFVATTDVDGDADLDMVFGDPPGSALHVFFNDGSGRFGRQSSFPAGNGCLVVTASDLNGDESPDLASANQNAGSITLLFNDGVGSFRDRKDVFLGGTPLGIASADLDNDEDTDLVVSNPGSRELTVLFNRSDGTFDPPVKFPVRHPPVYVAIDHLDGDRFPDLVTANGGTAATASVFLNRGDGTFTSDTEFSTGSVPHSLITTDMNLDGLRDLVVTSEDASTISVLSGNGDGSFGEAFSFRVGGQPRFCVAGDLNGNGAIDLSTGSRATREATFLFNQISVPTDLDFLEEICTDLEFESLSIGARNGAVVRETKYIAPARDDPALLPPMFQNVRRHALHQEFLAKVFGDHFPALSGQEYNALVGLRETRDYFVGVVNRLETKEGLAHGFSVLVDTSDPAEVPNLDEVTHVFETLSAVFAIDALGYFPDTELAREVAASWEDPGFAVFSQESQVPGAEYAAYSEGVGYGRVRLFDEEEFETASAGGQISFQDILVLERAPRDIAGVFSGLVTAEVQGELSHTAIRTRRRGTPNAFVAGALEVFEPLGGQLVRLDVREGSYRVSPASREDAEAFWDFVRPTISVQPRVDPGYTDLADFDEINALESAGGELPIEARFGGKASNLARLQTILTGEWERYREKGFAIPMAHYLEFMETNTTFSLIDNQVLTYQEFLFELFENADFDSDPVFRVAQLRSLRDAMESDGVVNPALIQDIVRRIREVLGSPDNVRVRHRSSSNAEDALEFNGAGLYESTAACVADTLDDDDQGPSLCRLTTANEREIQRALKRVWSSLWNFGAYEEREFFRIEQPRAAMGVLVNRAFDESANGVAFTGVSSSDRRYVITAQAGDASVVSPEPGVRAEKDLLEVEDGEVRNIIRAVPSSLVPPGTHVLSDDQLSELGALLWHIDQHFPLELGDVGRDEVVLDLEFKFMPDGELAVKQVRPFLLTSPTPTPTFELEIPPGTVACGVFGESGVNRGPRQEYELKSTVRFRAGGYLLPTRRDTFSADIVEELIFGPDRQLALSHSPGQFRVQTLPADGGATTYRFTYQQKFELNDGDTLLLELKTPFELRARDQELIEATAVLDNVYLTALPRSEPVLGRLDGPTPLRYGSCDFDRLPLWEVVAELEDGSSLVLKERFLPVEPVGANPTGPASLVRAELLLADGTRRVVRDYWNLVYSAARHNTEVRYWVVLDPPARVPGVNEMVRAIELRAPQLPQLPEAQASYLGERFEILSRVSVVSFDRQALGDESNFLRGDALDDGQLDTSDVLLVLRFLFAGGLAPECLKSADSNDDGRLNLSDAIATALHLFQGRPMPAPATECGSDPTPDGLGCDTYGACP